MVSPKMSFLCLAMLVLLQAASAQISVSLAPTTLPVGGIVTATYGNHGGANSYLCWRSAATTGVASPACATAGVATEIGAGSAAGVVCSAASATGAAVPLTLTQADQLFVRVRACTANADAAQTDNAEVALTVVPVSVAIAPTGAVPPGGTVVATYTGHTAGVSLHLCYRSGAATGVASPACGAAGVATTITAATSGAAVVCTAAATTGAAVPLIWADATQGFLRVRACITNGDTAQTDNAQVAFTMSRIPVALSPLINVVASSTLTATYSGLTVGTPAWVCFRSGTASGVTTPKCLVPGNYTAITQAGSGTGDVCTASASTGAAVSLTWTASTNTYIKIRACLSAGDVQQVNNNEIALNAANNTASTTIRQLATFTSYTEANYNLYQTSFNKGYGYALGIYSLASASYATGNSVVSTAASTRRADLQVQFQATVTPATAAVAQAGAANLTANPTNLAKAFTTVDGTVVVPTVGTVAAAVQTDLTVTATDDSLPTGVVFGLVITAISLVLIGILIVGHARSSAVAKSLDD